MTTQFKSSLGNLTAKHPRAIKWAKRISLVGAGFMIGGFIIAAGKPAPRVITKTETKEVVREVKVPVEKVVTKTHTEYKTPTECHEVIEIDNKIFLKTSDALNTFDFQPLADHVESVTPERTALIAECVGV